MRRTQFRNRIIRRAWVLPLMLFSATAASESPATSHSAVSHAVTFASATSASATFRAVTPHIIELPNSAPAGSRYPYLFAGNGRVLMSWLQQTETGAASLWFARLEGQTWSTAQRIASGDNWFINWADFPAMAALPDGTLVAHWLQKTAPDTYAYDVRLSFSDDAGRHWSAPISPHDDGSKTEHGFVSLLPRADNTLSVVWLDGRDSLQHDERMQLRHARFDSRGKKLAEYLIDSDTCTCCQTSAALLPDGLAVAYRDHTDHEIRDIALLRLRGEQWQPARIVHADGWEIAGCPVNGPALASTGHQLAVAWYTGAQQQPRVQAAFSTDTGAFVPPLRLDDGAPLGRVALVMPTPNTAIVGWLERDGENALLRVRRLQRAGDGALRAGAAITAAHLSIARGSGFPRLAVHGQQLLLAWTDILGKTPRLRTALLPLAQLE